jgi:hypothetical protein
MPIPTVPANWKDDKTVPVQAKSKPDVDALVALAKLSRSSAAISAANKLKQKYGNWLVFDRTATKAAAKEKIAPEVIKLYRAALTAVKAAPLPTGKYQVAMTKQSKPKFMHNATQAGTLPVWTFAYWDEGQPTVKKSFQISMTRNMYGDENKQAEKMSDAAIAKVKGLTKATVVKVV